MNDEPQKEGKSAERELWKACNTLWAENVRQDLVYSTKLALCKSCASFFYSHSEHDHPREDIVAVQEYFMANDITSACKMVDFFRPSHKAGKVAVFDQSVAHIPTMSTIHKIVNFYGPTHDSGLPIDRVTLLCRDTTKQMMEVVDQQNKTICDLRCEVEELRNQNEELLLKMVKLKAKTGFDKRAMARLANHMLLYCEECQCEHGQCDHAAGDAGGENKAK